MALQDKFKKKEAAKVVSFNLPPSIEDLRFCRDRACESRYRPSALSWRSATDTYVLTATVADGAYDPTWVLHVGGDNDSAVAWTYTSSDTDLIYGLIAPSNDQSTGAVIPESLRPQPVEEVTPGTLPYDEFSDKCEITSQLGFGGMGVIYKARLKTTQQVVALKVLHGHLLEDSEITARFMQEASNCLELRHRNLIKVLEYGVSKRGKPYMIMEYLEGQSLADVLMAEGRLEIPRFINIFTQICDGLQFAHEKKVVHRDVKPSNIMVVTTEGGWEFAKLLDFGIAKEIVEEQERKLTPTGNVVGSPAYISPEQCAGAKADPRNDVYSLGCVMYEALSGQPPFMHESPIKVILMQLENLPPPLSSVCPEGTHVPEDIEQLVMRCLEKDPAARYSSAADLGAELWSIAARRSLGGASDLEAEANQRSKLPEEQSLQLVAETTLPRPEPSATIPAAGQEMELLALASSQKAIEPEMPRPTITVRLSRCRSFAALDGVWEGLVLADKIQERGMTVSILLETESVLLVLRPDSYRLNLDEQILKRMSSIQAKLLQLIKGGATVFASERWAKRGNTAPALMPGAKLLNDDQICDLIIERRGTMLDY